MVAGKMIITLLPDNVIKEESRHISKLYFPHTPETSISTAMSLSTIEIDYIHSWDPEDTSSDSDDSVWYNYTPVRLLSAPRAPPATPPPPPPPNQYVDPRERPPTKARHAYFEVVDDSEDENRGISQRGNKPSDAFSSWISSQQNSSRPRDVRLEH
jgi:hypothetical protein